MSQSSSQPPTSQVIEITACDRWQVYRRLQELDIICSYRTNEPLSYQVNEVTAAIQVWSVVRQLNLPRREIVAWLEKCWQCPCSEE
ncbi:MAG: hypothetical protein F6K36_10125 [Symploca sp. SIO3C6]|uniref:Uncharacterized protein n=1 Tax=Symploca sp. SIO1C4 TaxID=2607765 RepID=A0A6B3NGJ5_9CYAN|nr:hypothetical protein [Symploca sp. SIO3C6]NER32279.1 hypothetical protein [Symploca sp. SIO1C4]NET04981.1 hypothetical protein [Symploca sp. SIO2B6]NET48537.1 hypothetical protein [Merismopedia sp. SIO2A8]